MSTQEAGGIECTILPENECQQFRLLELPAELLQLLTSHDPPTLQFKSQEGPPGQAFDSNAVICTDNKTYNLRQVNTSNSVFIIHPSDAGDAGDGLPRPGLQAVAQCDFTLELNPIPTKDLNAMPYIRAALPTYSSTGHYQATPSPSKADLFANISLSKQECETAYTALACFQLEEPPGCFIPSGEAKVRAWKSILEQAISHGIDLTEPLSPNQASLVIDAAEDWPIELTRALKDSVSVDVDGKTVFVESTCIKAVGLNRLEAITYGRRPTDVTDFMAMWADQLPEKWRGKVNLDMLKDQCVLENDGHEIMWIDDASLSGKTAPAETKSLGAKRKWHDKFRAAKKPA